MSDGGRLITLAELGSYRTRELSTSERTALFWRHVRRAEREIARPDPRHVLLDQIAADPAGPGEYDGTVFSDW